MELTILTPEDLQNLKQEILNEIRAGFSVAASSSQAYPQNSSRSTGTNAVSRSLSSDGKSMSNAQTWTASWKHTGLKPVVNVFSFSSLKQATTPEGQMPPKRGLRQ